MRLVYKAIGFRESGQFVGRGCVRIFVRIHMGKSGAG